MVLKRIWFTTNFNWYIGNYLWKLQAAGLEIVHGALLLILNMLVELQLHKWSIVSRVAHVHI